VSATEKEEEKREEAERPQPLRFFSFLHLLCFAMGQYRKRRNGNAA